MPNDDLNMVKPVEGLQNITGLAPTKRREERKRKRDLHERQSQKPGQNESSDEPEQNGEVPDSTEEHEIDYCA